MGLLLRFRHALPACVLALVVVIDLAIGRQQSVLTLTVVTPLVAATVLGRRATAGYAALALVAGALLGIYDNAYRSEALLAQVIRLCGIALVGVLAVAVCTLRQRRELLVARMRAEAAAARGSVELAEQLQRSLLTDPPPVPGLQTAVRYLPAVRHAEVGGDWYDAFGLPCGATMLVIGDVAGHDITAATTMAQARGVLRGIAQTVTGSPAAVLAALDRALQQLGVDTPMTVVVATLEQRPDGAALRWSNAGHPAPALIRADGTVEVLERMPDLLLGVAPDAPRVDHELPLRRGDTLLLYTDGLVERRGVPLDDGTAWLAGRLAALAPRPLAELCDELLADMPGRLTDDVAVLAVRLDG